METITTDYMKDMTVADVDAVVSEEIEARKTHYRALVDHYTKEISRHTTAIAQVQVELDDVHKRLAVLEDQYPTKVVEVKDEM